MPAVYEVAFTQDASRDVIATESYLAQSEGDNRALDFLERLAEVIVSLSRFPERGSHPKELAELGIAGYRQIVWGRYRLIYRVERSQVMIYLIADGRRDMKTLLAQRLLGA